MKRKLIFQYIIFFKFKSLTRVTQIKLYLMRAALDNVYYLTPVSLKQFFDLGIHL